MLGNTTVDEPPVTLRRDNSRPHSRSTSSVAAQPTAQPAAPTENPGHSGPPYPYFPLYPPPPWAYQMGGYGPFYPPNQPSGPHGYGFPPPHSAPSLALLPSNADIDIITWCSSLDHNERHNKDGLTFEPYGHILKKKGFLRLSQLMSGFVQLSDMQAMLEIELGTAVLIFQYAKEDLGSQVRSF